MVRMDKLLEAWRADPKIDATVELCAMLIRAALKAAPQKLLPDPFVIGFANEARSKHPTNLDVAIAVSDLYMSSGLNTHAGAVLEMAEKLAPADARVKERLSKIRRSPTREFATRTPDPETLDAPTAPLDPPTEPVGTDLMRNAGERKLPGGRRPTTIGLPAAPPPLPAPPMDRRTKMGLASRASVGDAEEKTEGDTHTESPGAFAPVENPRRQKTALFGPEGKEETALGTPPEPDDDSPPTKVEATSPADAPITRVEATSPADAPITRVDPVADDGPPTKVDSPAPPTVARPKDLPPAPSPRPPAARERDPLDAPSVVKGLPPVAMLSPDTSDDSPPTAVQPVSRESLALSGIPKSKPAPRTLSSEVSRPVVFSPARPGASPTDRGAKVVPKTDPAWAKKEEPRKPIKPTLLDSVSSRQGVVDPAAGRQGIVDYTDARRDDPRDDPPTKVEPLADSSNVSSKDPKLAARRPVAERRAVRPMHALEEHGELPTKIAEAPDELRTAAATVRGPALGSRPSIRTDGFAIPPPPPSDPETETTTKVREPEVIAAEREALLRRANEAGRAREKATRPLADHELGEPSTLSGAITNLWSPALSNPIPERAPRALANEASAIELSRNELIEDDDEDEAVTGLKDPMPLVAAVAKVSAKRDAELPSKGGTLAMQVNSPASFPLVPPGLSLEEDLDDADNPRTKVLSAREAMTAAITADPRPPHAHSRHPGGMPHELPSRQAGPMPMSAPVVARGMMVGAGNASRSPPPAVEVSLFAPPPASVPTFGAPPVRAPVVRPMTVDQAPDPLSLAPLGAQGIFQSQSMRPAEILQSGAMQIPPQSYNPAMMSSGSMRPMDFMPGPGSPSQGLGISGAFPRVDRPTKLYVALVLAILAVTGLVAYAAHLLLWSEATNGEGSKEQGLVPATIADALARGTPASLASADVELTKLEGKPSVALAKLRVEQRVLASFEVSGGDTGIRAAIDAAIAQGAAAEDLAYAEVAALVLVGSHAAADEIVATKKDTLAKDALFRWMTGILYERTGRTLAKAEFDAALELRPTFAPARLRLLRQSVLASETEPLATAKRDASVPPEALQALDAWAWAVGRARGRQVGAAPTLALTSADVSRTLHPAFGALGTMSKEQTRIDPGLKQVANDAETPTIAVFWGDVAKGRGDEGALVAGALRALSLSPGFPDALRLLVQNVLRTGRFQELTVSTKGLSPLSAKPLLSVASYETGDVGTLAALAQDPDTAVAEIARARLALLRGPTLLTPAELDRLIASDPDHGELCGVDRLLLSGAVKEARAIVGKWPTQGAEASHAARALRIGRVLRAEGKWAEAEKLLGQAPASGATQIERVLVGAETRENRSHASSLADERAGAVAPFLQAYVVARAGDPDAARAKLPSVLPAREAPWSSQLVAAMLLAEIGDPRAAEVIDFLSKALGANRDLARAATRFEETKEPEDDEDKKDKKPQPRAPRRR